ncbi:MAG: hypothetical protein QM786_14690 [Breznakibacter sp.]
MWSVERYQPSFAAQWDGFVKDSWNGVFLFYRAFMDYHADRFTDHSLVVRHENKVVALFPANERNGVIHSHQGLTYGGWVIARRTSSEELEQCFALMEGYYRDSAMKEVVYKQKPSIFAHHVADNDAWLLWRRGYVLWRRDLSFVIDLQAHCGFARDKRYRFNKSQRNDLTLARQGNLELFMRLVKQNLNERFLVDPVHTVQEAVLLQSRFPKNISTWTVHRHNEFLGGCWLFSDHWFVHTQYLHTNDLGKELCAAEFLVHAIIDTFKADKRYFSFGTSTESDGQVLNYGLASFKEGFGASGVCHDFYKLTL